MTELATKPVPATRTKPTSGAKTVTKTSPVKEVRPVPKEYSFEEVYELNHNGGRYELVDGRLVEKKIATFNHGKCILRLGGDLYKYVKTQNLGAVSTNAGFILRRKPGLLHAPDISFVSKARIPETGIPEEGYWEIIPDLAVEIVSPNDIMNEVLGLAVQYVQVGIKEVWIIAPAGGLVLVYQVLDKIRLLSSQDYLENNELLPGFKMALSQLFS